jgi:hypothetical protein
MHSLNGNWTFFSSPIPSLAPMAQSKPTPTSVVTVRPTNYGRLRPNEQQRPMSETTETPQFPPMHFSWPNTPKQTPKSRPTQNETPHKPNFRFSSTKPTPIPANKHDRTPPQRNPSSKLTTRPKAALSKRTRTIEDQPTQEEQPTNPSLRDRLGPSSQF